jgi:hypothetical protein
VLKLPLLAPGPGSPPLEKGSAVSTHSEPTMAHINKQKCFFKYIKKMWYLYTMEFYAAMKKNEMLSFAGKWMELENIILGEIAWPKRPKIICSPSYADIRSRANTTR